MDQTHKKQRAVEFDDMADGNVGRTEDGSAGLETRRPSSVQRINLLDTKFRSDLEHILDRVRAVEEEQSEIARDIRELKPIMDKCSDRVEVLVSRNAALENASAQLANRNGQFYEKNVVEPIVRHILPMFDLVRNCSQRLAKLERNRHVDEWARVLAALATMIEEFVGTYGVEPYRHQPGTSFDGKCMRPLRERPTHDQNLHLTVHESCQCGFRKGNRVIRPEQVIIYTFAQNVDRS